MCVGGVWRVSRVEFRTDFFLSAVPWFCAGEATSAMSATMKTCINILTNRIQSLVESRRSIKAIQSVVTVTHYPHARFVPKKAGAELQEGLLLYMRLSTAVRLMPMGKRSINEE